ncbi:PAS domain S-box protein, partial [Candidatus Bathyarchaeota archaeon]|nr:PAS domain S-box protein [Candidatus Bathyarchaeota archaeon]
MVKEKHESLYESLFKNNRDAVIFFNETTIVDANKSALDLFEVDPDEFIGHEIYEFTLDKEKANKRAERRLQGVSESFTTEIRTPKGVKELEVSSTAVNIENITSYSIIRDITERKNLEQRFRVVFEHSRDLIFITSKDAVEFINPRGVEYLGYSSSTEIIGKHPTELIHPDYRELATRHATMRRSGGTPPNQYRAKMITKNGVAKPVEFNASFIEWGGKPGSLTIARDISKQVELEEELRHGRQILIDFTESATDAFSILDEDLRFIMVNETELEYSGLEREDYIGNHMLEVFPGLKDTGRYAGYQRVLETGDPVNYPEVTTRNGEHIINYTAFKAGDYLGILGRDITEQKRLEEEKERAYAELAAIYDSSPIIMILVDEDRRVRAANHVSSKFAQRHIEEMMGLRGGEALRCIHHLDNPKGCGYGEACEECTIRNLVLDTHKTGTKHDQVETSLTVSQGEENKSMNLLVSTAPILVESESLVLVSIQDITELKQKEKKLRRANQVYQAFNKGFREILRNDSFEKTARTLFNDLTELIDAKSGYVALLSDDGSENELLFLESGGLPCTVDPDLPMPIRGLREKAYESGKGVYENSFHNSEWQRYLPEGHVKLNNVLFAPLNIEKKTVGIIGIANKSTDFTDEDLELAESFGELAAIALKHTRFLKDIQESRERLS